LLEHGAMRTLLASLVLMVTACGGSGVDGGGDDGATPDAAVNNSNCPLPDNQADLGALPALKAQRCNVSGSMGMKKWYRLSATMTSGDIVQIELWPFHGSFTGAVTVGSFPIETDYNTCGVCLRAVGDKGAATMKEYFGTSGMINVTALGAAGTPFSATITTGAAAEVNAVNKTKIANGCTTTIASVKIDGTMMDVGMTGGGGGGGGGGGMGACLTTVGD
jgi:hypothetical protein